MMENTQGGMQVEGLYEEYLPQLRKIAHSVGVRTDDIEDAIQVVFEEFLTGYAERYDPSKGSISAYFLGQSRYMFMNFRNRAIKKSAVSINNAYGSDADAEGDSDFDISTDDAGIEQFASVESIREMMLQVIAKLETYKSTDTKNFARLFRDMVECYNEHGTVSSIHIAKKYGYTRQAVDQQVSDLRRLPIIKQFFHLLKM